MAKKPTRKATPAAKKPAPKPAAKSAGRDKARPKSSPPPSKPKPAVAAKPKAPAKPLPMKPSKKPAAKPEAPAAKAKPTAKPAAPAAKPAPASAKASAKPAAPAAKAPAPAAKLPAKAPGKSPALKGKDAVRARILAQRAKPAKPASFSLDEVLAIARTAKPAEEAQAAVTGQVIATKSGKVAPLPADALKPAAPSKVKAASLADILGFNPRAKASHAESEEDAIPEKFKRYYKLLIELRNHVTGQVDQHSEETLKRSAKEDSGDLSSYGTDGGTDSFDRDFALSLVANEQEALAEIEAAIQRIKAGNYGICEHTGQPIPKERLTAVPFTRYTAAAMKEIEKTRYKVRGQTGILGEGEEGAIVIEDGGDE